MEKKGKKNLKPLKFYSDDMVVPKEQIHLNYLKLTYQRLSVRDLDRKHKEWGETNILN